VSSDFIESRVRFQLYWLWSAEGSDCCQKTYSLNLQENSWPVFKIGSASNCVFDLFKLP